MKCERCYQSCKKRVHNQKYCPKCQKILYHPDGTDSIYGPSPCDECPNYKLCSLHKMACRHFYLWTELYDVKNVPRSNPTREYYARMFPRDYAVEIPKTTRGKLLHIMKISCNGQGINATGAYILGKRLGYDLANINVRTNLNSMCSAGLIVRVGKGRYNLPQPHSNDGL